MKKRFLLLFLLSISFLTAQETRDTLVVGYTPAAPFIIDEDGLLEGINVWLWQRVAEDLNLEFEMRRMPFAEMLEAVKKGEIDVSINPLTITSDRIKEMGFSRSFFASHSTVVVAEKNSWQKIKQFVNDLKSDQKDVARWLCVGWWSTRGNVVKNQWHCAWPVKFQTPPRVVVPSTETK